MARVTVEIFGKPGCHLCDDARAVIDSVVADLTDVDVVEHNILDDAEWFETMKNDIPVVVIDGVRHTQWRVEEDAFRNALTEVQS